MTNVKRPVLLQVRSLNDTAAGASALAAAARHSLGELDNIDDEPNFRQQFAPVDERRHARPLDLPALTPSPKTRLPEPPPLLQASSPRATATRSLILPTSSTCDRSSPNATTPIRPTGFRCSMPVSLGRNCYPQSSDCRSNSNSCRSSCSSGDTSTYHERNGSISSSTVSSSSSSSASSSSSSSASSASPSSLNGSGIGCNDSPSLILPYLYVGDQAQTQLDTISSLNISYILSLQSLPKFLSNSPQSSPPETPTACNAGLSNDAKVITQHGFTTTNQAACPTIVDPNIVTQKSKASDSNFHYDEHKIINTNNLGNSINKKQNADSTTQKTNTDDNNINETKQLPKKPSYDIIGGGDGGLLPSANSSKDYLVKMHRLIKGKCINISDTFEQILDKFFDETHNFIEEARRNKCNVLVHCKAGISRSPTIAIAYLMKWKRLHLQDAYNFVKRCRPQISPNLNFMGQLVSYERRLLRCRSQLPSPTSNWLASPISLDESDIVTTTTSGIPTGGQQQQPSSEERNSIDRNSHRSSFSLPDNEKQIDNLKRSHQHKRARVQEFFKRRNHNKKAACVLGNDK